MEVTNVPDCDDNDYSLLLFHPNTLFCGILEFSFLLFSIIFILPFSNPFHALREIHPLDSQPHRHCTLAPRACAPRVTRCSLRKYWSRDFFQKDAGRMICAVSMQQRASSLWYTGYLWRIVGAGSRREGDETVPASSNFAASHYES